MMREYVSGRFDYQFETRWSRRIVHAGVILANARDRHSGHAERVATRADADPAAEHGRQRASVDDAASTHDTRTHQSQPRITGAFPNQAPSRRNDQGSGLLGGKV
jgi:hypothetical protein